MNACVLRMGTTGYLKLERRSDGAVLTAHGLPPLKDGVPLQPDEKCHGEWTFGQMIREWSRADARMLWERELAKAYLGEPMEWTTDKMTHGVLPSPA